MGVLFAHNWINIKNKHNGFTRKVAESEFNNMIDKADYEVVVDKPKPKKKSKKKSKE